MKISVRIVVVLLIVAVSSAATADDLISMIRITGFHGISWGAGPSELKSRLQFVDCQPGELTCLRPGAIGMAATKERFEFTAGRLTSVSVTFDVAYYGRMKQVFIQKYGAPHSTRTDNLFNLYGAEMKAETVTWRDAAGVVVLTQFVNGAFTTGASPLHASAEFFERNQFDAKSKQTEELWRDAAATF